MKPIVPLIAFVLTAFAGAAQAEPSSWRYEFPKTDFSKHSVDLDEIISGGPPRDGIPSIDDPKFVPVSDVSDLSDEEPVIGLIVDGEAKAYPLRVLVWHEIVNDVVSGVPVTVTYCPLCNSAIVFERMVDGRELDFGTTGKLRNSDLVMYDRQTESFWQQFLGVAIVGQMTGTELKAVPARLESFAKFRKRAPDGMVLVPNDPGMRDYGRNPYEYYDGRSFPYPLFTGQGPDYIEDMARVVVVGDRAWSLRLLREKGSIEVDGLRLAWEAGQNSALDAPAISDGRDVGNVTVRRKGADGWQDAVYDVTFAFVYHAFHGGKRIITE